MDDDPCPYCTPGEPRDFRVEVCDEIYTIKTTHGREARRLAQWRYIKSHDWFASDDPWRTVRCAKVIDCPLPCQLPNAETQQNRGPSPRGTTPCDTE